jgi:hypothetical protein
MTLSLKKNVLINNIILELSNFKITIFDKIHIKKHKK